jgi:hypothetical protein
LIGPIERCRYDEDDVARCSVHGGEYNGEAGCDRRIAGSQLDSDDIRLIGDDPSLGGRLIRCCAVHGWVTRSVALDHASAEGGAPFTFDADDVIGEAGDVWYGSIDDALAAPPLRARKRRR